MVELDQEGLNQAVDGHENWLRTASGGERANLSNCSFKGLLLHGSNLRSAIFAGAVFDNCVFDHCNLAYADFSLAKFKNVEVRGCDLSAANFHRSHWLSGCIATERPAHENVVYMSESCMMNFDGARIIGVELKGVFSSAQFVGGYLVGVEASRVGLDGCCFLRAIINNCNLTSANILRCDFSECTISSSNFDAASIDNSQFDSSQIEVCSVNEALIIENNFRDTYFEENTFRGSQFINLNSLSLIKQLERWELRRKYFEGAVLTADCAPLPANTVIEWSDYFDQNVWVLRC